MLLGDIDLQKLEEERRNMRPLIVTKDSPRRAYFKRVNRGRVGQKTTKRYRQNRVSLRGNVWSGNAHGQRVVVKINPVKNKARKVSLALGGGRSSSGGSGANLSAQIGYISRSGAGENEEKAVLFDKDHEGIHGREFFERARDDRHHFRMIISPENGHQIDDFREYVRDVMARVEKDLGTTLDWVSAVHYDTDDIHAHVVIRGRNDRDQDLVIGRDYISTGIRLRAQERATELLGERSLEEIQKSIEKEVDALRVTSLDRFIEGKLDEERQIDVRRVNNFGRSAHYEQVIKGRLRYLETTGLASQHPPGVFHLEGNFKDVLYGIQNRNDVLRQLHGRFDGRALEGMSLYSIKAGEGETIEGFVQDGGAMDEISDKRYLVVEDMNAQLHHVPVGERLRAEDIAKGTLIRVRPGDRSSGKADYNIDLMARKNEGVYDLEKHRTYVEKEMGYIEPENRQGYLDSHIKRLETLEQNGVVEALGEGRYRVVENVIERGKEIIAQINARERKRFYPMIDVLSKEPMDQLVTFEKKTWLDKELYKQSLGKSSFAVYNAQIRDALEKRQDWLIGKDLGYIQSNGVFALRDHTMRSLNNMEIKNSGEDIAARYKTQLDTNQVAERTQYRYLGYVELETGHWAVVANRQDNIQMVQLEGKTDIKRNAFVEFDRLDNRQFQMRDVERQQERAKQSESEQERDDGMER